MMRRAILLLMVVALVVAACGDDDATTTTAPVEETSTTAAGGDDEGTTTTTAAAETTTTSTTKPPVPPGAAFILKGETGPYVFALQSYLDCDGYGPLDVDGVFGDGTAAAVMKAQATEGKEQTGEPDEETFGSLSRGCDRPRDVAFPAGSISAEVAGNAAPGDDEVFNLRVLEGQEMTITIWSYGFVDLAVQGADGTVLHRPDGSLDIAVTIPTSQMYALRVSADTPTSYQLGITIPAIEAATTTTTQPPSDDFYLSSNGFNVIDFGQGTGRTIAWLTDAFGPPGEDTGWFAPEGGDTTPCAEQARVVTWLFPGTEGMMATTLDVTFHDGHQDDDEPTFRRWRTYLTWGYDDVSPEPGWLNTIHGLSVGDDYMEAVGYGFQLGGYEETSVGSLDGIRIDIATNGGTYEDDGQVLSMQAGSDFCYYEEP